MDIKEQLKQEAWRIYNSLGSLKKTEYADNCKYGLGVTTYRKFFKSHNEFLRFCGIPINKNRSITKDEIDDEIIRVFNIAKDNNEKFWTHCWSKYSKFTIKPLIRIYESFDKALDNFPEIIRHNDNFNITKDEVIRDIIEVHNISLENDEKFNLRFYNKHSKYGYFYLKHFFDSYQDAVDKLGLTSNVLPTPTKYEYIKEIKELYLKFDYISLSLLARESNFKHKGLRYLNSFGGYINILEELNIPYHTKTIFTHSRQVFDYAEQYLKCKCEYEKKWDWLVNPKTGYKFSVDCYFPNVNLVIEYHGRQHYEYNDYFHKSYDDFINYQNNDRVKKELIIKNRIYFLEFPYYEKISYENVVKKIDEVINNKNAESFSK